jgi:ankyrin repeat protein
VKDLAIYSVFENHGVDLKTEKNEDGASILLLVAAHLENENELNDFLKLGLELKSEDKDGNNIFHYTARKGNISFLKMLVEKGIDAKKVNKNGGNAILMASRGARGHQNSLEFYKFLESQGIAVNVVGDYGRNPLHAIAYRTDDIAILNYFMNKGVNINLQDDGGDSPFMNAASNNKLEIVTYLFNKGIDIHAQDETGKTALTMAINRNEAKVVDFLLKNEADTSILDKKGNSLAYYLINSYSDRDKDQFEKKLKLLKAEKISMTATQEDKNTLYHIAVLKGNLDLIKYIADFNVNINAKNEEGLTALHLAAMKAEDDAIIKYLISKGADLKIKTDFEESVYDLASENELLQNNNTSLNFLK